jgi:hypothetical protein
MIAIEKKILGGHEGRAGHKPIIIVNHVTVGGEGSVINTFSNLANKVSSTFLNCRDGSVVQFCEFTSRPKTNGIIRSPRSPIVIQMGNLNPNYYSVTIENEDAYNDDTPGVDGQLTDVQFYNLCWLHKYIQTEVKRIYGNTIPLNSSHVLGHRDIDSVGKSLCPGNNFPMNRLLAELAIADKMTLEAYEERLEYLRNPSAQYVKAFAIAKRIESLHSGIGEPKYGNERKRKLTLLLSVEGIADVDALKVRVCEDLYSKLRTLKEANRKLEKYHDFAEEKGLL